MKQKRIIIITHANLARPFRLVLKAEFLLMMPAAIAFSSIVNNSLVHELKPFPLPAKQSLLQSKIPPANFVTNIFRG